MSLTTSWNLFMGTGLIHCCVGLLIPEIRQPLVRIGTEWTTEVGDMQDRYPRECAFWFHFGGIMMISQGYLLRRYCLETGKRSPRWFGWYLTALGALSVSVMPTSGFWLVIGQGLWILSWGEEIETKLA